MKENIFSIGSSEFYHWADDQSALSRTKPHKRTVTSFELIITRCWDGLAVHVRAVGRFEIDDKRPIRLSVRTQTDIEGEKGLAL
jgi:hypothetical protein